MYEGKSSITEQRDCKEYTICLYIRLSMEDDDVSGSPFKTESGETRLLE